MKLITSLNLRYGFFILMLLATLFQGLLAGISHAREKASTSELVMAKRNLLMISRQERLLMMELDELKAKPSTDKVRDRMVKVQSQLDVLGLNFEIVATHLQQEEIGLDGEARLDWLKELENLTRPILGAIKELTERPRKIDTLKKRIESLEARLSNYRRATENIQGLLSMEREAGPTTDDLYSGYLAKLYSFKIKYDPELVEFKLKETRRVLKQDLKKKESLFDLAVNGIKEFFKNRGRNLLVTFLVFMGTWWFLAGVYRNLLGRKGVLKLSPGLGKLMAAAYNVVVLGICLTASMVCLYIFNDWLLISVIIMLLLSVAWTSRQWIPRFLKEVRLILNLGTVREGERMIWKGVPWLVKDIGFYATLINEQLEGGRLLLPVSELLGHYSRQVVENEPWFPTRQGDWVIMADKTYGEVCSQTSEQVVLRLEGDTLKYYSTSDFMSHTPKNISRGFMYIIEFGLDYEIQQRICDEIPLIFHNGVKKHLARRFSGASPDFRNLVVMFDSAGASSLNIAVTVEVDGRHADRYYPIRREIQTALVRICNENGLTIPFTQLTVNLSDQLTKLVREGKEAGRQGSENSV